MGLEAVTCLVVPQPLGAETEEAVSEPESMYVDVTAAGIPSTSSPKAACSPPSPPEERWVAEPSPALLQCHGALATVYQPKWEEKE